MRDGLNLLPFEYVLTKAQLREKQITQTGIVVLSELVVTESPEYPAERVVGPHLVFSPTVVSSGSRWLDAVRHASLRVRSWAAQFSFEYRALLMQGSAGANS